MINKKAISIATGVIITNIFCGHYAPTGIMLTPVMLTISALIVVFWSNQLRPLALTLIALGLVILNDLGLKLFAAGTHDQIGQAWQLLLLLIGLVPTYTILILGIFKNYQVKMTEKIIPILLFPILIAGYLYLFKDLGLGRHYSY